MSVPVRIGIIGGIIIGLLQFYTLIACPPGFIGGIIFYSPQILYFACIYLSIRKTKAAGEASFKGGMKAGVITAFFIAIIWGIGFFIGMNNIDVHGQALYALAHGTSKADVLAILKGWTQDAMIERTKFWMIPNFLLGFVVSLAVTIILRRKNPLNPEG
ncbi:MAG TPA: hypothetical protein VFU15_07070 [Bacteroidia bacterium]|nr:hypothetical protein [Bacteroidia bacterium]